MMKHTHRLLNGAIVLAMLSTVTLAHAAEPPVPVNATITVTVENRRDIFDVNKDEFTRIATKKKQTTTASIDGMKIPGQVVETSDSEGSFTITTTSSTDENGKPITKLVAHISMTDGAPIDADMQLNGPSGYAYVAKDRARLFEAEDAAIRLKAPGAINSILWDKQLIRILRPARGTGFVVDDVDDSRKHQASAHFGLGDQSKPDEVGKMVLINDGIYTITIKGHYMKQPVPAAHNS